MDTDELLDRIQHGEQSAANSLFARHRDRLHRMVTVRLDARLAARIDPSDVVQDAIAEAHRRLPDYVVERPIDFYPWLRRIAWDRLLIVYRQHVAAERRSVLRECSMPFSEASEVRLVEQFAAAEASKDRLMQSEIRKRIRTAIDQLPNVDREVIALKHLEEVSFKEAAQVLELSVSAVHSRYYRAIKKLHRILQDL